MLNKAGDTIVLCLFSDFNLNRSLVWLFRMLLARFQIMFCLFLLYFGSFLGQLLYLGDSTGLGHGLKECQMARGNTRLADHKNATTSPLPMKNAKVVILISLLTTYPIADIETTAPHALWNKLWRHTLSWGGESKRNRHLALTAQAQRLVLSNAKVGGSGLALTRKTNPRPTQSFCKPALSPAY